MDEIERARKLVDPMITLLNSKQGEERMPPQLRSSLLKILVGFKELDEALQVAYEENDAQLLKMQRQLSAKR